MAAKEQVPSFQGQLFTSRNQRSKSTFPPRTTYEMKRSFFLPHASKGNPSSHAHSNVDVDNNSETLNFNFLSASSSFFARPTISRHALFALAKNFISVSFNLEITSFPNTSDASVSPSQKKSNGEETCPLLFSFFFCFCKSLLGVRIHGPSKRRRRRRNSTTHGTTAVKKKSEEEPAFPFFTTSRRAKERERNTNRPTFLCVLIWRDKKRRSKAPPTVL